ncbi:MAG: bacillithiol biosynthesis deacetylase BshB1 [Bryobacterales bacterium]|nr:bacillithiol biosynthesis deacetylase BshB1 [Bryobacterales bacterium]
MQRSDSACDLVVFSAHPDDAELCCGGLLLSSAAAGWRTGVVDLTRGEAGSLGTPEIRLIEAERASKILGLAHRRNLGLADGHVRDTDANRRLIVRTIRELRPQVVVGPPMEDHHPDHLATGELLRQSLFLCGVRKYAPGTPPWRPKALLHHFGSRPMAPQLVVDISEFFERRMEAVRAYGSQFGVEQPPGFPVRLASSRFLRSIEATLAYYGSLIGVAYGEPFNSELPLPVGDLVGLFGNEPWKDR